jgi:RNA polymerase sigma factor (sigma-70 family)
MGAVMALAEDRMAFRAELDDFGSFYERTYPAAFRTAWAILRDRGAAADTVQEAYLAAYRERARFRGDAPAQAWLLRIVVNRAISEARRRRPRLVALDEAAPAAAPADDERRTTDHLALDGALTSLEPRDRAAVVLRYYHDLDYATIASILGTNANNVGVILHRALERLQRELARPDAATITVQEVRHG